MNAREALTMLEYQIEAAADLNPNLYKAIYTLSAAIEQQERLLAAIAAAKGEA